MQEQNRIMKALSGFYYVSTPHGIVECRARGRFRHEALTPMVGDLVRIQETGGKGVLEELLPRKNSFIRPAVANMDLLVLLCSCATPVTDPFLIDRVLAVASRQDVQTLVCINKADLQDPAPLAEIYRHAGFRVLETSAQTGLGVDALRKEMEGRFTCFTGNSGVGKSSLLNRLLPELALPVGEVSEKLGRGRHTTRHIELYRLNESTFAADTPGFSSFEPEQLSQIPKQELAAAFPDFAPFLGRCQFDDCAHLKEPGCAVREALEAGLLEPSRYESYVRLYDMLRTNSFVK